MRVNGNKYVLFEDGDCGLKKVEKHCMHRAEQRSLTSDAQEMMGYPFQKAPLVIITSHMCSRDQTKICKITPSMQYKSKKLRRYASKTGTEDRRPETDCANAMQEKGERDRESNEANYSNAMQGKAERDRESNEASYANAITRNQ